MRHDVGNIIFVMLRKQKQVLPVLVVEETIKKRIDGETYTYTVQLPNREKTHAKLEKLDADVFKTLDDVKENMLESAAMTIEKIITGAEHIGTEFFPEFNRAVNPVANIASSQDQDDGKEVKDRVNVDLGNGVKGNIDISNLKSHGVI